MKEIIGYISELAKRLARRCPECDGLGETAQEPDPINGLMAPVVESCDSCAELREISEAYDREMEWPEWARNFEADIPALRKLMETVGVWEGLIDNLGLMCSEKSLFNSDMDEVDTRKFADILTSDKFYTVAAEFLKREAHNER